MIVSAIAVITWVLLALHALRVSRSTVTLQPRTGPALSRAVVTALIPARNEEEIVETSVRALLAQGDALARAVVVDDKSTDRTGEILARLRAEHPALTVLEGRGPGEGECGKPAALRDAVAKIEPTTEWLLFLDADVVLAPGALDALVAAGEGANLVSVFPRMEMESAVERWLMPSVAAIIAARYPALKVADPNSEVAFANGQVILIRRATYERAGGHASVVREILEDVRFAERVKASGGRLVLVDGRHVARTRMYSGARELIEGWSKNLYLLLGARPLSALAWASVATVLPSLGWVALLVDGAPVGAIALAVVTAMQMAIRARIGAPVLWVVFAPLAAIAVDLLILRSALGRLKKSVAWKGRVYRG